VPTGPQVILLLKVAVVAVTALFLAAVVALARGKYRLHGRLNLAVLVLTYVALLGLEVLVRLIDPRVFDYFDDNARWWLAVHLCFSVPAAVLLPVMLYTGRTHRGALHVALAVLFCVLWAGTFVTGVFFLPHTAP
jgi:hypothetical protein